MLQIISVDSRHFRLSITKENLKDVPGGFPKSDLLGVTVALIHVAAQ